MNAKHLALLFAVALPLGATAAPPDSNTIRVNCAKPDWPTREAIARDVGMSTFDPVEHVRHRAIIAGMRACRSGATDVDLVFEKSQQVEMQQMERVAAQP